MSRKTDEQLLAEAQALDAAYARAEAFDAAHAQTRTAFQVYWDNGAEACGTFPDIYDTEEEAEQAAHNIETDNRICGVWDEDGFCEVIEVELPVECEDGDEMTELRKAALNRGQP